MVAGPEPVAQAPAPFAAARTGDAVPARKIARRSLRPTPACGTLTVVLLAVLLGAVNYQSNAAYLVLSLALSAALVSLLHTWRNLSGLSVSALPTVPVYAGEALGGTLLVRGGARQALALQCSLPGASDEMAKLDLLAPGHDAFVRMVLPPRGRGLHAVGTVRISSVYPFGLFRASVDALVEFTWLVYPRPLGGATEPVDDERAIDAALDRRSGAGDFRGHRNFVSGDPQRHIDWKAVARGRPLLIKDYGSSTGARLWIDWARSGDGDLELRLSRLAGEVVEAERRGDVYGLRLPGSTITPDHGPDHRHACLAALALFPGQP